MGAGRAAVSDCGASLERFVLVVVPEMALNSAALAQDQAALLASAAKRQRLALSELQAQTSNLGACKFAVSFLVTATNFTKSTALRPAARQVLAMQKSKGYSEAAVEALGRIYSAMGLDMADVMQLIGESSGVLEAAQAKVSHSA